MAQTPPEPDPIDPEPVDPDKESDAPQPQRRPYEDPNQTQPDQNAPVTFVVAGALLCVMAAIACP